MKAHNKKIEKYGEDYYKDSTKSNYQSYVDKPYNVALLNYILRYKKKGKLLELGCAFGFFLKHSSNYFDTYGMDISKYAIKIARKISPISKLKAGDIEYGLKKFIGDNKFDIIVALDVLEHLKEPAKIIHLIYKSLNKDGIFVFRVPNLSAVDKKYYYIIGKPEKWHGNRDRTHISLYTTKRWKSLTEIEGFKVKLLPYIPTRFMKELTTKRFKRLFFVPRFLSFTNMSITMFCRKLPP